MPGVPAAHLRHGLGCHRVHALRGWHVRHHGRGLEWAAWRHCCLVVQLALRCGHLPRAGGCSLRGLPLWSLCDGLRRRHVHPVRRWQVFCRRPGHLRLHVPELRHGHLCGGGWRRRVLSVLPRQLLPIGQQRLFGL